MIVRPHDLQMTEMRVYRRFAKIEINPFDEAACQHQRDDSECHGRNGHRTATRLAKQIAQGEPKVCRQHLHESLRTASVMSGGRQRENSRVQAACMSLDLAVAYPGGETRGLAAASAFLRRGGPADNGCTGRLTALCSRTVNRRLFLPIRVAAEKKQAWSAEPIEGPEV